MSASGRPTLTRDIITIHFVNNVVTKIQSPNHLNDMHCYTIALCFRTHKDVI